MKKKEKLKKVILQEDYKLQEFQWMTKEYGHAEFFLCPVVKRNKIREVHMVPLQQPNTKNYFSAYNKYGWEGVDFGCLVDEEKKVQTPWVWTTVFCKEHNSHAFYFYVPKGAKGFFFTTGLSKFCLNLR